MKIIYLSLILLLNITSSYCSAGDFRFRVIKDQVFDSSTQLTWKFCSYGQTYSELGFCEGAATAVSYAKAKEILQDLQGFWRLPSKQELASLVDMSRGVPTIDPIFSNTEPNWYWADGYPGVDDIGFVSFETGVTAWGLNDSFEFNLRLIKVE